MPPRAVFILFGLFWTGLAAAGPEAVPSLAGYLTRVWQVEEGLPQNTVTAVTQTRDGYLWIGTYDGLARFDGERFQIFTAENTPSLIDGQIISLWEDAVGGLWIGHESGAVTLYRAGHFAASEASETGVGRGVVAINSDATGAVWLLHKDGRFCCATDGRVIQALKAGETLEVMALARDGDGILFVLLNGVVWRLTEGKLIPVDFGPAQRSGFVVGMGAATGGGLWVVQDGRIRKWQGQRWTEDRGPCPWGDSPLTAVREMQDGRLAVSTINQGCYLIAPDGLVVHFDQNSGLPQNWVRALYQDRENNLWLGIGTGGLVQVKPTPFVVTNPPDRWQGHTVLSVAPGKNGALWIGTEGAGLYKFQRDTWSHYDREQGLGNPYVWSVAEDADGHVWAGTWSGGVFRWQDGRLVAVPEFGSGSAPIIALQFSAEDRSVLAGVGGGLFRWHEGVGTWVFQSPKNAATNICTVARDSQGVVWFGISGGGLGRWADGVVTVFRKADGLPSERVNCLLPGDAGVLWIGTADGGLCRWQDGRFATISLAQGLASPVICHIADDGRGFLWLSTHHGIQRLAKAELNACADGVKLTVTGQWYTREDGLPTLEYSGGLQAAGCQTTDGRLWFTSNKGLVSVDPANIQPNLTPPPVVVESLQVDGRTLANPAGTGVALTLAPDHQRLEFHYTALSLTAPNKVKFKYRLKGLDRDWVEAGNKRSATYSQLPHADYQFQVIACNNDGAWNLVGAEYDFTVRPFYWQTWWCRLLVGVGLALVIGGAVRFETRRRLHRRIEALEQERAIERERTRIAQDIHDDIGASLTRITLLSQEYVAGTRAPEGAVAVLRQIALTASAVTQAFEEIVWAVAPRHDTLESLICYMAKFAQDFLGTALVRCRLDLPPKVPACALSADLRHNLFLAFKEALNNAVKHAGASEVSVSLTFESARFILAVKDNGRGLDHPLPAIRAVSNGGSGQGLLNLQHRLAQLGGRCEFVTEAGAGTTVRFHLPPLSVGEFPADHRRPARRFFTPPPTPPPVLHENRRR